MKFTCASCGYSRRVGDHLAGKKAKCPKCSSVVELPAANTARHSSQAGSSTAFDFDHPAAVSSASEHKKSKSVRGWIIGGVVIGLLFLVVAGGLTWYILSAQRTRTLLVNEWVMKNAVGDLNVLRFNSDMTFQETILLGRLYTPGADDSRFSLAGLSQTGTYEILSGRYLVLTYASGRREQFVIMKISAEEMTLDVGNGIEWEYKTSRSQGLHIADSPR